MFRSGQHTSGLLHSYRVDPVNEWMVLRHRLVSKQFTSTSRVHESNLPAFWSSSKHTNPCTGVLMLKYNRPVANFIRASSWLGCQLHF